MGPARWNYSDERGWLWVRFRQNKKGKLFCGARQMKLFTISWLTDERGWLWVRFRQNKKANYSVGPARWNYSLLVGLLMRGVGSGSVSDKRKTILWGPSDETIHYQLAYWWERLALGPFQAKQKRQTILWGPTDEAIHYHLAYWWERLILGPSQTKQKGKLFCVRLM
jgi:hypothetical protein